MQRLAIKILNQKFSKRIIIFWREVIIKDKK